MAERELRPCARGRVVDPREMREPAEMAGGFFGSLADDRQIQAAADDAGDVAERDALFGDPVIPAARNTLLEHEAVETGRIEPVHGRPAVESLAQIGRGALLPPSPWTEGGRRTIDTRAPVERAACSETRGIAEPAGGALSSVARRPD